GDTHAAETLVEFGRGTRRRPGVTDSGAGNPETSDQGAVGLPAQQRGRLVGFTLDLFPTTLTGPDDPVVGVGHAAREGSVHLPVQFDIGVTRAQRADHLGELVAHLAGRGPRVDPDVEVDLGRRGREGRFVGVPGTY